MDREVGILDDREDKKGQCDADRHDAAASLLLRFFKAFSGFFSDFLGRAFSALFELLHLRETCIGGFLILRDQKSRDIRDDRDSEDIKEAFPSREVIENVRPQQEQGPLGLLRQHIIERYQKDHKTDEFIRSKKHTGLLFILKLLDEIPQCFCRIKILRDHILGRDDDVELVVDLRYQRNNIERIEDLSIDQIRCCLIVHIRVDIL